MKFLKVDSNDAEHCWIPVDVIDEITVAHLQRNYVPGEDFDDDERKFAWHIFIQSRDEFVRTYKVYDGEAEALKEVTTLLKWMEK